MVRLVRRKKMKCVIVIDGESANELFAVGPKDLRDHFLPNDLHVQSADVVKIHFEELKRDEKIINSSEAILSSKPYSICNHPDNFERK
jgi:hypothetical protein